MQAAVWYRASGYMLRGGRGDLEALSKFERVRGRL
jgi:hypothetical protein